MYNQATRSIKLQFKVLLITNRNRIKINVLNYLQLRKLCNLLHVFEKY